MRLHQLTVTGFGPFGGTEQVDFDELNDAGLFLMTGPTGAGKSSVLDAICFALYGQVPGVRGVKTLRSQHAAPDTRPEVVLDFSVRERRFVIRRAPEWSRPKRRGEGTTTEKATASLVETTSGTDHFLSSRAQEVGHLVGELVGLHAAQFVQVAMLPQGEFQHFLQASSQDRHTVLERLFRTDRFSRIEDWVHDHSRALGERSGQGEREVQRVLDAIADRAEAALPEALDADTSDEHDVTAWAEQLLAHHAVLLTGAELADEMAVASLEDARTQHQEALRTAAAVSRRDAARSTLATLAAAQDAEDVARRALEADTRADRCSAVLDLLDLAQAEQVRLRETATRAAGALAGLARAGIAIPETPSAAALADLEEGLRRRVTHLEALLPRERALLRARQARDVAEADLADRRALLARDEEALERLPVSRAGLDTELARVAQTAARADPAALELATASDRLRSARLVPELRTRLTDLATAELAARERTADARDHVQELMQQRLAGIAVELAGRLGPGQPCQVCGSTAHPSPATGDSPLVTEQDQQDAEQRYARLTRERERVGVRVAACRRELDAAVLSSGGLGVDVAQEAVRELTAQLSAARTAATRKDEIASALTTADAEAAALTARVHELRTEVATLAQGLGAACSTIAEVEEELAAHTSGAKPADGLGPLIESLRLAAEAISGARTAFDALDAAAERAAELSEQADGLVRDHGFGSVAGARAARLGPGERQRLDDSLGEAARARERAALVLKEPEVAAVGEQLTPDVPAAAAGVRLAEAARADTRAETRHLQELVSSLEIYRDRLTSALSAWAPLHEESRRADSMSKLVRGMGADNHLQVRLSAYVLAARLDQVLDAANERLAHMRDQRYLLERTGRAARKGAQAGLGLQVVDEWTGDVRDPVTLSGGETFVVSLALALGLADVVSHESGGVEIETLFVDEGFGMLDADTLDDVMDRLDGLRAGGRTVGVVSHVSELRNRIPTQLHVDKTRTGSTLALRTTLA